MRRIFPDYAYGEGPRHDCWWDATVQAPQWPTFEGRLQVDVAIAGGGYTGLSAALHLAEAGVSVALLEAVTPGWGASGRNGGFCCLGGSRLSPAAMRRRFGDGAATQYWQAEHDAITLVRSLIDRLGIDAELHSDGETRLAHSPRAMARLRREAGDGDTLIEPGDLAASGMGARFHGALTCPAGFALNPQKYLFALARAARAAGARLFARSPVGEIADRAGGKTLVLPGGDVRAEAVLICTNGYSSEDLGEGLAGRYMPAQSTVMVTRPLTKPECLAQGWTSRQMAYDTRRLLHYFRLMPDNRFLFGMRGGLVSSPGAESRVRSRLRRDFEAMFPAWRHVPATHAWSGMVCLARNLTPFVGPVPGRPGVFAALAYHGNGVGMGTYCGRALAGLVGAAAPPIPVVLGHRMGRFPLGRFRRALMPPVYAALALADL